MADQQLQKRPCVMIVDHDMDFGIKLADWLAANGYQAVLVRSAEAAIDECPDLQPQAIFIALGYAEPTAACNLRRLFHTIETACPRVPVITMGERIGGELTDIASGGALRHLHLPLKPLEFTYIGRLLRSELYAAAASPHVPSTKPDPSASRAVENRVPERTVYREVTAWTR